MSEEFVALDDLLKEYDEVEKALADPSVHNDRSKARTLGRRYAELGRIACAAKKYYQAKDDLEAVKELAAEDDSFAEEIPILQEDYDNAYETLTKVLAPRDEADARDILMEIKAGEGGAESALFASDLLRMYLRYAERKGWSTEILSATDSDLGGYKDVSIAIKAKGEVAPEDGVWAQMKFEGGVHRVQRVPATESQGRIHTSAAGVLVMPEAEETGEIEIDPNDLRIDVYRSSGPGGQSVNTTDSAVRITHIPTGIVVAMQNEKSQLQNKEAGMRVLRARLLAEQQAKKAAEAAQARQSQVRTVDRSERIRTYNFPENRIVDHRTGYKAYNLDQVMDGDLEPIVRSCVEMDEKERLANAAGSNA